MDKAEATGLGIALAGHAALLAVLSLGFATALQPPVINTPIEVSFVDEVGLVSAVPEPTVETPAQSVAPDLGTPEEAAPQPVPTPAPPEPVAAKPTPAPPEPKPIPKPSAKAAPAKPAPPKAQPKQKSSRGTDTAEKSRGSRLGDDFLKGLGRDPSPSKSQKPTGAVMSAQAASSIGAAIARQVQPCADRQVNPGPGASRIRTSINLRLNRNGSLAARPRVMGQTGVDDENRRYAERVADLAIATFTGCAPLRNLPAELYDVPNGWSNFTMNYSLPG